MTIKVEIRSPHFSLSILYYMPCWIATSVARWNGSCNFWGCLVETSNAEKPSKHTITARITLCEVFISQPMPAWTQIPLLSNNLPTSSLLREVTLRFLMISLFISEGNFWTVNSKCSSSAIHDKVHLQLFSKPRILSAALAKLENRLTEITPLGGCWYLAWHFFRLANFFTC